MSTNSKNIWEKIKSGVQSGINNAVNKAKEIGGNVSEAVTNYAEELKKRAQEQVKSAITNAQNNPALAPAPSVPAATPTSPNPPQSTAPAVTPSGAMTYEEWLRGEKARSEAEINQSYSESKTDIENSYVKQLESIEKEHGRSVTAADTEYQKSLAGYGKNAELLASMGLTGSGYSDYLNAQAYAQKNANIRQADTAKMTALSSAEELKNSSLRDAKLTKDQSMRDLESSYTKGLMEYRDKNYGQLLSNAESGLYELYSEQDIQKLISDNNLTVEQAAELRGLINLQVSKKNEEKLAISFKNQSELAASGHYDGKTESQIRTELKGKGFSDEEVDMIIQNHKLYESDKQERENADILKNVSAIKENISYGAYGSLSALQNELKLYGISDSHPAYAAAIASWQEQNMADIQGFIASGESVADTDLLEFVKRGEITEEQRLELIKSGAVKDSYYREYDEQSYVLKENSGGDGKIKVIVNGKEQKFEKEKLPFSIKNSALIIGLIAEAKKNGSTEAKTVIPYQNKLYYNDGDSWYELKSGTQSGVAEITQSIKGAEKPKNLKNAYANSNTGANVTR